MNDQSSDNLSASLRLEDHMADVAEITREARDHGVVSSDLYQTSRPLPTHRIVGRPECSGPFLTTRHEEDYATPIPTTMRFSLLPLVSSCF